MYADNLTINYERTVCKERKNPEKRESREHRKVYETNW